MIDNSIYDKVSKDLNIDKKLVKQIYESYFEFIKNTITKLPLENELTEEEFSNLKTNFNIPSLGKLWCDYIRYNRVKQRLKYQRDEHQKNQAFIHKVADNSR